MKYLAKFLSLLALITMTLTGCGGSSSGAGSNVADPLATGTPAAGTPIFGTISSAIGKTGISITTDRPTIDVNNGQVLVTAKLVKNGAAVSGVPVTFSIVAPTNGPATVETGLTTVNTDSNGMAVTRITTGNNLVTTNVIVQATSAISGQNATATTTFQIVRGNGVIMFTSAAGATPGSQTNILTPGNFNVPLGTGSLTFFQLMPFKVTDSNGNPRVGVPVTLSTYSITTLNPNDIIIDFLVPKYINGVLVAPNPDATNHNQQTITTDSAGMGIFNTSFTLTAFALGLTNTANFVLKAETSDTIPITAYIGGSYSLTTTTPASPVAITPAAASFGTATDISFVVSGGAKPYIVSSNNTARATATLQADGTTVLIHLVDASAWTGAVTISAVDSASQTASATVTR